MNTLRIKLWLSLLFVMLIIAVPAVVANHALKVIRAQHARAEASAQTLSAYQRLAVLGYTLQQERYVDPANFVRDRALYIDGVRSHVTNAERYINAEIKLISETALQRKRRAEAIENEVQQRETLHRVGASLEKSLRGNAPDTEWEDLIFGVIRVEEREAKEFQRSSFDTVSGVTDAMTLSVVIVGVIGLAIVIWGQWQVIRPLGHLWQATRDIADGNYNRRVPAVGTTEFRTIAESFNTMAARVQDAAQAMQRTNEELERAVQRRTAELDATNRSLTRANSLRQQFLADASHELRTPLSIMRSEAEITLRNSNAQMDDLRHGLQRVVRLSSLMAEMIEDMLQVARAEEPMLQSNIGPVDAVQALRECVGDFQLMIESDGGHIRVDQMPERMMIEGDETRLKQAIRIVLDNAVCYSSEAPEVEASLHREDAEAVIVITDHGDGIASEDIPYLFQRFRRGSKKVGSGQGLGLSIARSITEAMGGSISLQSRMNVGTAVTLRLPLLPAGQAGDGNQT